MECVDSNHLRMATSSVLRVLLRIDRVAHTAMSGHMFLQIKWMLEFYCNAFTIQKLYCKNISKLRVKKQQYIPWIPFMFCPDYNRLTFCYWIHVELPCGIMRNRPCDSCSGGPGEFGAQILKRPIRVVDVSPSAIVYLQYKNKHIE